MLDHRQHRPEAAVDGLEQGRQSQGRFLGLAQHPGLGQDPPEQAGQHRQRQKDRQVEDGFGLGGTQLQQQAVAAPAQGEQRQHGPQLGGHQGTPQMALQPFDRPGAGPSSGGQFLDAGGAQADQGQFAGGEEGQQGQQQTKGEEAQGQTHHPMTLRYAGRDWTSAMRRTTAGQADRSRSGKNTGR